MRASLGSGITVGITVYAAVSFVRSFGLIRTISSDVVTCGSLGVDIGCLARVLGRLVAVAGNGVLDVMQYARHDGMQ